MLIESTSLIIRDFVQEDWSHVHRYASNETVTKYMIWGPNTEKDTKAFISRTLAIQKQAPRLNYEFALILKESGQLIGGCGIHMEDVDNAEIGYCLHPDYWGRGYATEAALSMLNFGFSVLGVHRIFATCHPDNLHSSNVMKRIGMQQEGILREHIRYKGKFRDSCLFSILVTDKRGR